MILTIDDYITKEEKIELYKDAMDFALKKKEGKILCRVLKFNDNDTPEQTMEKLKQHALWRYTGNVAQRLFVNFIQKEVGEIEHDILYTTRKGHIGDIDTITKTGLRGDIKSSTNSKYMNVNWSDLKNNDVFIKIYINIEQKTFEICGYTTKQYIYSNIKPINGIYRVNYEDLNHNIEQLKNLYK